jgi:hypothetical protein
MLVKAAAVAIVFLGVGALLFQQHRTAQVNECFDFVANFESAYKADRPSSESGPSDLRNAVPLAQKQCQERRFADATKTVNTAGMICRLNNGCEVRRR